MPNFRNGEALKLLVDDVGCAHNTGCDEQNAKIFNGVMWITNYQILWKSVERENTVNIRKARIV